MSPAEALEFKRHIGDRVKWTNDPLQGEVNQALGQSYRNLKDALNVAVPELRDLNEQYSDLVGAAKSIQRRIPIENRNAHWSLSDIALAGTGHIPIAIARKIALYPGFRTRWTNAAYRLKGLPTLKDPLTALPHAAVGAVVGQQQQEPDKKPTAPADEPDASLSDVGGEAPSSPYEDEISSASTASGVDPNFIRAVIGQESGGKAGAVSIKGATGLMQLMPDTAEKYGVTDATDPSQNVLAGAQYLRDLLDKHDGDAAEALMDYYGRGTPPPGYPSAAEYAEAVLSRYKSLTEPPRSAPAPLPALKAEAAQRKPSPMTRASATTSPNKNYTMTATGPSDHKIGSNDGVTWFDIQTGQQVD
jgi:hypothetical protein